jgi:hypothetical protein
MMLPLSLSIWKIGGVPGASPPPDEHDYLLLADGTHFLLLADGVTKLALS